MDYRTKAKSLWLEIHLKNLNLEAYRIEGVMNELIPYKDLTPYPTSKKS
jgi:hypothetical protein